MKIGYQEILFLLFVTVACALVVMMLLSRIIIFSGRFMACLHCGCELNTGSAACFLCGNALNPRQQAKLLPGPGHASFARQARSHSYLPAMELAAQKPLLEKAG
jgi:hypothetical protein